jgi:hypothetical protein
MTLKHKAFDLCPAVEAALIFILVQVNGSLLSLPLYSNVLAESRSSGTTEMSVSHESSSELIISVYP